MTILGKGILSDFIQKHADCRKWINAWIAETEEAIWRTPQDIKDRYRSASFLQDRVVIFNVKGNTYRLEVQVAFHTSKVFIRWIGTHTEYDQRNS